MSVDIGGVFRAAEEHGAKTMRDAIVLALRRSAATLDARSQTRALLISLGYIFSELDLAQASAATPDANGQR